MKSQLSVFVVNVLFVCMSVFVGEPASCLLDQQHHDGDTIGSLGIQVAVTKVKAGAAGWRMECSRLMLHQLQNSIRSTKNVTVV